jgi:hypothetical protein
MTCDGRTHARTYARTRARVLISPRPEGRAKKDVLLWQAFCLGRQILGLFCVAESVLLLSVIVWQTFIVVLILLDQ